MCLLGDFLFIFIDFSFWHIISISVRPQNGLSLDKDPAHNNKNDNLLSNITEAQYLLLTLFLNYVDYGLTGSLTGLFG